MSELTKTFFIAEAGVNHNGSESMAMELVDVAAEAGADAIKFQTFSADKLVNRGTATAAYQKEQTGSDDQYELLRALELSEQMHRELKNRCDSRGIEFMSTPFDEEAALFLRDLGMRRYKIPSGEVSNLPFLRTLAATGLPLVLSTGMATLDEVRLAVDTLQEARNNAGHHAPLEQVLTVLHCTSNYPTRDEDVNLLAMRTMQQCLAVPVGYSDHTQGDRVALAAVAMGATMIEKHFTLDRSLPGPDHQASLEPAELAEMIGKIRQLEVCLGDGVKAPRESELPVRDLVRRSVTLRVDKARGSRLERDDLVLKRPGTGLPPSSIEDIVGRRLARDLNSGSLLDWADID